MGNGIQLVVANTREGRKLPWKVEIPASLVGRRQRKFFLTKREAENFAEDFLDAVAKGGTATALDGVTVREAWDRFLASRLPGVGVATVDTVGVFEAVGSEALSSRGRVKKYLYDAAGKFSLDEI